MYTGVHVELNFSLKEDKFKLELHSKLATSLGGGSWMNCIALPLGSLRLELEVYFAVWISWFMVIWVWSICSQESRVVTECKNAKIKWPLSYSGIFPNTCSSLGGAEHCHVENRKCLHPEHY